jgi:Skp family chaperone for outer membrane proteins
MRLLLFLVSGLLLAGCGKQEDSNRDVLNQIANLKSELATHQSQPMRWATANKREIESAISEWTRCQTEAAKSKETLTPQQLEQVSNYEALSSELMKMGMSLRGFPVRPPFRYPFNTETNKDYESLSQKVEAAKAPIADILQQRSQLYSKFYGQYKAEKLIAEYVKDRFDLVIDSGEAIYNRSPVLYSQSGEAIDITQAVIKLFNDKTVK